MTSISKSGCIDKLDDIVNKKKNTIHTVKMKALDIKWSTYISCSKEIDDEDHRFKISAIVRILKYKNIFANVPNWFEEIFVIKKI